MSEDIRNTFSYKNWTLEKASPRFDLSRIDCGDADLNDYFRNDAALFREELLSQTYVFHDNEDDEIYAAIDFCNDALPRERMTGGQRRKISHRKRGFQTFPAVKITRLGVCREFQGMKVGSVLLEAVKNFFLADNRTGCRFITVDAYRNAVGFYERNDFARMLTKETEDPNAPTVPLFFDLKRLTEQAA